MTWNFKVFKSIQRDSKPIKTDILLIRVLFSTYKTLFDSIGIFCNYANHTTPEHSLNFRFWSIYSKLISFYIKEFLTNRYFNALRVKSAEDRIMMNSSDCSTNFETTNLQKILNLSLCSTDVNNNITCNFEKKQDRRYSDPKARNG